MHSFAFFFRRNRQSAFASASATERATRVEPTIEKKLIAFPILDGSSRSIRRTREKLRPA